MKRFNTITAIVDTGLITSTVITGGIQIAAFASGAGLPVGTALSETSFLLSLATVITQKSSRIFTVKQEKHNAINLLAQSKLGSIADIISQAMQGGDISSIEFHKILQQVEKYRKLKPDIKNQVSSVSVPFKIPSSSTLQHVILWSIKTIKSTLKICLLNT